MWTEVLHLIGKSSANRSPPSRNPFFRNNNYSMTWDSNLLWGGVRRSWCVQIEGCVWNKFVTVDQVEQLALYHLYFCLQQHRHSPNKSTGQLAQKQVHPNCKTCFTFSYTSLWLWEIFLEHNILSTVATMFLENLPVSQRGSIEFHGYSAKNKLLKAFYINC